MAALRRLCKNARGFAGVFFLYACLSGCTTFIPQTAELRGNWPADLPAQKELTEVPFFPQTEFQCGPAALATTLAHWTVPVTPDDLTQQVFIPARKGSVQVEMLAAPRRYGIVTYKLEPRLVDVLREIAAGNPVVVLQNYSSWPIIKIWHYAVAIGFDTEYGTLHLRSGENERLTIPLGIFEYTWKDGGNWAMVAVPPDRVPATAEPTRYFDSIVAVERSGKPESAAAAYASFLERWPGDLGASVGLANTHYAAGALDKAEAVLREALASHPDSVIVINNLSHTLSETGRSEEALALIEGVSADGPHAEAVSDTRSRILQKLGRR